MGALDEGHFCSELDNGVKLGGCCVGLEFEQEPETLAIEDAVKVLLQGLGEDINREGIRKTPNRVAKALREGTRGYKQKVKDIVQDALFPEAGLDSVVGHAGGVGGLVVVRDLDLFSYCESCLLPFQVKCHVGYVPSGQQVVGLSKLSRVADIFAKRLQAPQRLADEICLALQNEIKPTGVAVVLQCSHLNFPSLDMAFLESNHQGWVKALVTSGSGEFEDEKADIWDDFLCLSKLRGVNNVGKTHHQSDESWCPAQACSKTSLTNSGMVSAVSSIIRSLGENPSRKELVETPNRFVKWLMNFKNCNFDMKLNGFGAVKSSSSSAAGGDFHMQSELNLSFWSQCEHHLLPFHGVVHIGYISSVGPNNNPIGIRPLLQSIVHFYGFKLQVQERLTRQIAETASSLLGGNVMVVVDANHTCMISRGIEKFGSSTSTLAVLGRFSTESAVRAKFRRILPSSECS